MPAPGERVRVRVEVPKGSFVKRDGTGRIEFVSPIPCPFNYGSIVGTTGDDGDPLDAVVLGRRLARGTEVDAPVVGVVRFRDDGREDDKWVCGAPPRRRQRAVVSAFFALYGALKRLRHGGGSVPRVEWP